MVGGLLVLLDFVYDGTELPPLLEVDQVVPPVEGVLHPVLDECEVGKIYTQIWYTGGVAFMQSRTVVLEIALIIHQIL